MWFCSFVRFQTLCIFAGITIVGTVFLVFLTKSMSRSNSLSKDGSTSVSPAQVKVLFRDRNYDLDSPNGLLYNQPGITKGRCDVMTATPWLAPIVWEGAFDPVLVDAIYKPMNLTIATTVFAIGKYIRFLRDFLETAEKHFMVDFKVHYHIFTDQPDNVPSVTLAAQREIFVHQVPKLARWQDISSSRMQMIQNIIEKQIHNEADYIYCQDIDAKFHFRWGAETLDRLVAQSHPWFYDKARHDFTYERRPASQAYIPMGEGDFYYAGAMFGGTVKEVYKLVKKCHENVDTDKANGIEAIWQEESHLNWYLLYNKPSKILSPEYLWDDKKAKPNVLKVIRLSHVVKDYAEVRENV